MEASLKARNRLGAAGGAPLALDWTDAVFFNLAVDASRLQPSIPYPLDLYQGQAYVSIVCFDQRRFRTTFAENLLSPMVRPLGSYAICNLRTYVRHGDEAGVYFMREWMPNPVSPFFVNQTYGLPQRLARIRYEHERDHGRFLGRVTAGGHTLTLSARIDYAAAMTVPEPSSLDDWIMHRFAGFQTPLWGKVRFRIWHVPWPQQPASGEIVEDDLLRSTGPWYETARLKTVNYSPGIEGVLLGFPIHLPHGPSQHSG